MYTLQNLIVFNKCIRKPFTFICVPNYNNIISASSKSEICVEISGN